jgi:hypothetical protein
MVNQINRSNGVSALDNQSTLRPLSEIAPRYNNNTAVQSYNMDSVSGSLSNLGQLGIGGLSGYKYEGNFVGASQKLVGSIKSGGISDVANGFKDFGSTISHDAYNAAGVGALLSGGVSAVSNTLGVLNGTKSVGQAGANIFTDSVKGAVSGIGGMAVGGSSALLLTTLGLAGTPVVIASVVGGAIGASMANKMLGTENLRSRLSGY